MVFSILPEHAAVALGVPVDQVDLPKSQYGFDADALWVDARFLEIRRRQEAIARQMAEHRHEIHINLDRRAAAILKAGVEAAQASLAPDCGGNQSWQTREERPPQSREASPRRCNLSHRCCLVR